MEQKGDETSLTIDDFDKISTSISKISQKATKRLRAENATLRKEIEEIEIRHMNDLKAM